MKKHYIFNEKVAESWNECEIRKKKGKSDFASHTKHFEEEARSLEPKQIEMIKFMIFVLHGSFCSTFLLYTRSRDEKWKKITRKYCWNMYQKNVIGDIWRKKRIGEARESTQPWMTLRNHFYFVPPLFHCWSVYQYTYKVWLKCCLRNDIVEKRFFSALIFQNLFKKTVSFTSLFDCYFICYPTEPIKNFEITDRIDIYLFLFFLLLHTSVPLQYIVVTSFLYVRFPSRRIRASTFKLRF